MSSRRFPRRRPVRTDFTLRTSEPHDVIPAIHVDDFASDARTGVRSKKHSGAPDFGHIDVALQGRTLSVRLKHVSQPRNATRGQGFDWTRRDRVHTNLLPSQILSEVTDS